MRIKKLEIIGFKSFADREVVHVDDHVTGVIGPNGCGKSNIVDAIRWTLGEQRAKHLRGSGMQDVIFAGCATRGPGGMAEVTLTFENDGSVPASYLNYSEIGITRRLYSDGTSEYLINTVPCRLRDIQELMLGTGAGARGYSIIEQGQVGKIVSSKPEDRRTILDEAAGITRFKAQKIAAERRIEQTLQNLLRVNDILGELEGRLGTLRKQAQKAERYKRYRSELRDLDLWTSSHRYLELEVTARVLERRRADLSEQVAALKAALAAHEGRIEAQRAELALREATLKEAQQKIYDLENRLQLGEAEEGFRRREQESLRLAIAQSRTEAGAVERTLAGLDAELEEACSQLQMLEESGGAEGSADAAARLQEEHDDLSLRLRNARADLERARSERGRLETQAATLRATLAARADALTDLEQRIAALEAEAVAHEETSAGARDELEAAIGAREAAEGAVADLGARRVELDRERQSLREAQKRSEVEVDAVRGELQRARSRLASLEEIQGRYRGCASGVQVIMQRKAELSQGTGESPGAPGDPPRALGVLGIMADFVAAPADLEVAVSAVLGDRLQGVVVDAPSVGVHGAMLLKEVQEGRTAFLPREVRGEDRAGGARGSAAGAIEVVDLSTGEAHDDGEGWHGAPGVRGRLVELIDVRPELRGLAEVLLGDAIVVDELGQALELWQRGVCRGTIVTAEGDRIEPSGVIVGGSSTSLDSALLQQKREIRELEEIVRGLQGDHEQARLRHQGIVERLAQVEAEREASEARVLEAERTRMVHVQDVRRLEQAIAQTEQRVAGLRRDRGRLAQTLGDRSGEQSGQQEALAAAEARIPALEATIVESEGLSSILGEQAERAAEMLTEAKVALARFQQQIGALEATKGRLERQAASERERSRRLAQHAETGEQRVAELEAAIEQARADRSALLDQHAEATKAGHDAREAEAAARLAVDEAELSIRNLRGDLDEQRELLREIEMALKERSLELGHLEADIRERFECELLEVLVDFHDRAPATAAESERVKELRRVLSRMGEVNLTAIDEYEEVSERFEYLSGQKKDLESAIAQLQEAIDKINKTSRDRFLDTFKAVNEMFQQLFPRLFSGGRAELKLTDPNDLLGTGVEIIAQPPGKQVRSLELLSGGEKALTAVSLIFAIFLIKPSPFCLLDEVDAPLDEANVGRFSNLVKELAERTQFIIITHNKRTMEVADRLYGVTMEQRGVSKLVSVNIKKAVELAFSASA
ncbi:MAG: chromosome segregation protein SMC [Nannocystaceae bacterium]